MNIRKQVEKKEINCTVCQQPTRQYCWFGMCKPCHDDHTSLLNGKEPMTWKECTGNIDVE